MDDYDSRDDSVTETSTLSWGSRIIDSIKGIAIGLALLAGTASGLFWNEGRAVTTTRSLDEGQGLVTTVTPQQVATTMEGRLVYLSGDARVKSPLTDAEFGVSQAALRLVRWVEMYQWDEDKETSSESSVGGSATKKTVYRYERKWSSDAIDSSRFRNRAGHQNPAFRYQRLDQTAADAELGAFRPGSATLAKIAARETLPLSEANLKRIKGGPAHLVDGRSVYLGADPQNPAVGDMRISFRIVPEGPVSLIGRQTGSDIIAYQTTAGDKLLLVRAGAVPADQMFADAHKANSVLTWVLRAVLILFMWLGFYMLLRPLVIVADVVPLFGAVLGAGAALAAFVMTLVVGPATIALAWFVYRPVMAVAILLGGLGTAVLLRWSRTAAVVPAPALASQSRASRPAAPMVQRPVRAPIAPKGGSFLPPAGRTLRQPRMLAPKH